MTDKQTSCAQIGLLSHIFYLTMQDNYSVTALRENPRVLLWATPGPFAQSVLQRLLDSDLSLAGIVLPGADGSGWQPHAPPRPIASDVLMQPSFVLKGIAEIAWEHGIPVFSAGDVAGFYDSHTHE